MGQFVLGRFIIGVASVLDTLLTLYFWVLLIAALLSFVNPDPRNPIVSFLRAVTDPVLYWVRRRLPFVVAGRIDFSPLVVMLAIKFTQIVVVQSLYELAVRISAITGAIHVV
jgi:YggT family protein